MFRKCNYKYCKGKVIFYQFKPLQQAKHTIRARLSRVLIHHQNVSVQVGGEIEPERIRNAQHRAGQPFVPITDDVKRDEEIAHQDVDESQQRFLEIEKEDAPREVAEQLHHKQEDERSAIERLRQIAECDGQPH